jgi:hypothetical protein
MSAPIKISAASAVSSIVVTAILPVDQIALPCIQLSSQSSETNLDVLLDIGIIIPTTDQSLGVENGVGGVHGGYACQHSPCSLPLV